METSLEEIERDLLQWAGRVAAGEAELLRLIGEWDAREGWGAAGALSCAHWLSWQLGYGIVASRERLRVARCLRELPLSATRMAEGKLSYSQARALTRVATADDEQTWLDLATQTTAEQLQKAVRAVRRAGQRERDAADPEQAQERYQPKVRWEDDGALVVTMRFTPAQAPGVLAALEQGQAQEQAERDAALAVIAASVAADASAEASTSKATADPDASAGASSGTPEEYHYVEPDYPGLQYAGLLPSEKPAWLDAKVTAWHVEKNRLQAKARAWAEHQERVQQAAEQRGGITRKATLTDGLVRLLTGTHDEKVKLTLLIDPMSGWTRTTKDELLPPLVTAQLLRGQALPRIRPLTADDLRRCDQGRSTRLVTPRLRQLLGQLDGECCRFPGCTRSTKLQAHHVVYWRDGGPTDLSNLALMCSRHHTVIHEQGFRLQLHADRTLTVSTKDGVRLEHLPARPWQAKEGLPAHVAGPSQWNGDRLDLHHVAWVLTQHAA